MRTVSTQSLLNSVARKMGLDPSSEGNVNSNIASAILTYCDERAREIWEMYDWQDLTTYEERAYAPTVIDGNVYNPGDIVFDPSQRLYFQSNFGGKGLPALFPSLWTQVTVGVFPPAQPLLAPSIALPQLVIPAFVPPFQPQGVLSGGLPGAAATPTGTFDTVFGVWATDPRLTNYPIPMTYSVTGRGIELRRAKRPTVWVEYRPPYPGLGVESWDSTLEYEVGDNIFYAGDTYSSLVDNNTNNEPDTSPASWAIFQLPYVLSEYVKATAYGDALMEDGQSDKANQQFEQAASKAVAQFEKQSTQQDQTSFYGVVVAHQSQSVWGE